MYTCIKYPEGEAITTESTTVHVDEVHVVAETSKATAHVAETSSNTAVRDEGVCVCLCVYTCAHAICTII